VRVTPELNRVCNAVYRVRFHKLVQH
jgi:hypothetical protein